MVLFFLSWNRRWCRWRMANSFS